MKIDRADKKSALIIITLQKMHFLTWHFTRAAAIAVVAVALRVQTSSILTSHAVFSMAVIWKENSGLI